MTLQEVRFKKVQTNNTYMMTWKNNLTDLVPYKAGEQIEGEDVIKLNANENPYPPSPKIENALGEFDYQELKKYPALDSSFLDKTIAEYHGVQIRNVFSGNSSDEVLAMCFKAFFNSKSPILFPDITYSFYPVWCSFYDIDYDEIALGADFSINIDDYKRKNGGIIIPNPNAPTGIALSKDEVSVLVEKNKESVIIIDEAYVDFADFSAIELTRKYHNLLVVRTTSKSRSLAGLRVGYAIGSHELIQALHTAMHSFNAYPLSILSMKVAQASFFDRDYFLQTVNKIKSTRIRISSELENKGFKLTDSKANFIFMTHENIEAGKLYEYLYDRKILVRYFAKDKLNEYLRISIGTDKEMSILCSAIDEFMEENDVI